MILASGTLKKAPMSLTIRLTPPNQRAVQKVLSAFLCLHPFSPFPGSVSSVFPHSPVYADFPQSQKLARRWTFPHRRASFFQSVIPGFILPACSQAELPVPELPVPAQSPGSASILAPHLEQ